MSTILDVVTQRIAGIDAKVDATDAKVSVERDSRVTSTDTLSARCTSLEQTLASVTDELVAKQQQLDQLSGRVDALLQQLTELGVNA